MRLLFHFKYRIIGFKKTENKKQQQKKNPLSCVFVAYFGFDLDLVELNSLIVVHFFVCVRELSCLTFQLV